MAKPKKCKVCEKEFAPTYNSTQKVCSPSCAIKLVDMDKQAKAKKARSGEIKRVKQKLKQLSMNDRPKALRAAQAAFNAFIRERDKDLPCICCGKTTNDLDLMTGSRWDAGHYRSVGSAPELRFNEDNCHKQTVYCNRSLSGNAVMYRKGLIARIGLERVEALECEFKAKKYTVEELHEINALYVKKKKDLINESS